MSGVCVCARVIYWRLCACAHVFTKHSPVTLCLIAPIARGQSNEVSHYERFRRAVLHMCAACTHRVRMKNDRELFKGYAARVLAYVCTGSHFLFSPTFLLIASVNSDGDSYLHACQLNTSQ
jgi:hypothetical protein